MTNYITVKSDSTGPGSPIVHGQYDERTGSWQYICADPETRDCAIIDPVLDFDPQAARTTTESAQALLNTVKDEGYKVAWILDTHPHADHLTAGRWLARQTGSPHAIGEKTCDIANIWTGIYNLPDAFDPSGDFDRMFADGDTFQIGNLDMRVIFSPGHTLGSITYVAGDAAFVHDTLMQPDSGTARADFPGGSSADLWNSIQELLSLPESTRLFIGHDYGTKTRKAPACEATVAAHLKNNIHVKQGTARADFIKTRDDRDATLSLPTQMLYALQVNLRAGQLPKAEADGNHYFKIPANRF